MKKLLGIICLLIAYFVLYEILPVNLQYNLFIIFITSIPFVIVGLDNK